MNGNDRDRDGDILRDVGVIAGDQNRDRDRERHRDQNRERRRGVEVSSDNLGEFDWKNRRQIVVRKCLPEISKDSLQKCKRHLTSLSFRLLVTRVNLYAFLSIGQNLTQIVFENVLLDEYKPLYLDCKPHSQSPSQYHEKESNSNHSQKRHAKKRLKTSLSSSSSPSTFKRPPVVSDSSSATIELPHLKELYFSASISLTKNDYNLLDFFLRCVTTKKLEYFEFIGNARLFRDLTEPEFNPVTELYGQKDQYQNIVARFLIKNRPSLKFIVIGGTGFKMFNQIEDSQSYRCSLKNYQNKKESSQNPPLPLLSSRELEDLQKLDLTGLDVAMDDNGIEVILSTQKNLQSLVVTAITFDVPQNIPLLLGNILQCCRNNYETLVEFYFKPKIISQKSRSTLLHENIQCLYHSNSNPNNTNNNNTNNNNNSNNNSSNSCTNCTCCTLLDTFTIDCNIFGQCPSLKYLTLSLNILTSEHGISHGWPDENTVTSTIQGVSLKNLQSLSKAKGLRTLHLDAEQFNFLELELLANQFFKFSQLREFSFRASPNLSRWTTDNFHPNGHGFGLGDGRARNISFLVRFSWIWVLFKHSRMTKVNFEGGVIDDIDGVHEFINLQRDISFIMDGTKICFEKIID